MMKRLMRGKIAYGYITPAIAIIFAIFVIPLVNLVVFSFAQVNLIGKIDKWVGTENYEILLTSSFQKSLGITAVGIALGLTGIMIVGTILAMALNKPIAGRGLLRAIVIIPWVIPHVFAGTMWAWVFNSNSGIINNVLLKLGVIQQPISFLGADLALFTVIFIRIWKGVPFLVMSELSALQTIPAEVEEAAMIDGSTGLHYFFHVILPLLKSVLVMSGTILLAWSITIFDLVYVITGGGPLGRTTLLSIFIYKQAFVNNKLGTASAVAVFTMVLVAIIAFFLMRKNIKENSI